MFNGKGSFDVLQGPGFSSTVVFTGIIRSVDSRDTVSLLHSAGDQDCLQEPHKRSPVLFGLDSVSGCTLRQDIFKLKSSAYCVVTLLPCILLH